jgi:uncharacterized coiled-coil protein SlyX
VGGQFERTNLWRISLTDILIETGPAGSGDTCAADDIWEAIGCVTQLLTPDHPAPIGRRLEQLGLSSLESIICEQQTQIAVQQQRIAMLTAQTTNQQMALERLQGDVAGLLACVDMRPRLIGGRLPALSEITQLRVQIFHTPGLSPAERKAKTEWSLRLTVWINGLRATEEIKGVQLYSGLEFAQKVAKFRGDVHDATKAYAEQTADRDPGDLLIGMLRAKTKGKGTPYISDQVCLLGHHLSDRPVVRISIGGEDVEFQNLRPATGRKAGHAKWWDEWVR